MAMGYEGYVKIEDDLVLATSASAPKVRNRIDSQSGYEGFISGSGGMGMPHTYDFPSYDGNCTIEVTQNVFNNHLKDWIISGRDTPKKISMQNRKSGTGDNGMQRLPECYWTSLSFDASTGNGVLSNLDFISWKKYTNSSGAVEYTTVIDQHTTNRLGLITSLGLLNQLSASGDIPALNPSGLNLNPIPWWKTSVSAFSGTGIVAPLSWSLSFSQEVNKLFTCSANEDVQEPAILAIGPLTGQLQIEIAVLEGSFSVPTDLSNVVVTIGTSSFGIGRISLGNFADDVRDPNSQTTVGLTYDIYGPLS